MLEDDEVTMTFTKYDVLERQVKGVFEGTMTRNNGTEKITIDGSFNIKY